MYEYGRAKAYLFDTLLTDVKRQSVVVNVDDPFGRRIGGEADKRVLEVFGEEAYYTDPRAARAVVSYSFSNDQAAVYTTNVKFSIWETELTVETPLGILKIVTPLIGRPNVYNILACIAASMSMEIELSVVVQALENAEVGP